VNASGSLSQSEPLSALRIAIGAVLFGGTTVIALHFWLGLGGSGNSEETFYETLYDAVVLSAGLACFLRILSGGRERRAWMAISAAILSSAVVEFYLTAVLANDPTPPFPSLADAGYLAFYPLAATGIFLMIRARWRTLDWRLWMDAAIAGLGTAALGAALVFEFVADRASGTTLQVAVTLAYPLGDTLMLALVVGIVALTRWHPGRTWSLVLLGLASLVFADMASTLQEASGSQPSEWIKPIYLLGAVFIGAEALHPRADSSRPTARFDGWRELIVPSVFAVVMVALFSLQQFSQTSALTTALWAATMLAVIARLAISVRENKRLLEQVRTDPLTGLGNQAGMQVDLANLCLAAAEEPGTLLLLDLNGFKRFNDTFGHPAGDAMLAQLGAQLNIAVADHGSAYRIGGDEFAVLLGCELDEVDEVSKHAAEALTADGEDYRLSAAWGSVAIPVEAETPARALQLADVRMYAQKQSRRIAHQNAIEAESGETAIRLRGPLYSKAVEQRH
jgi:two-component system, cell cycle response regulator